MKDANERNRLLYETLITFEENDFSEEDINNYLKNLETKSKENDVLSREWMETSRIYWVLREKRKYVEVIKFHNDEKNKEETYMQITEPGWDFIYNYQENARNNETKLRENERIRKLEDAETKRGDQMVSLTRALVWATCILALGALIEILKYLQVYPFCL